MVGDTAFGVDYWWADLGKVFQMETPEGCNPQREQAEDVDSGDCGWAFALANRRYHCSTQKEETEMSQARKNLRNKINQNIEKKMMRIGSDTNIKTDERRYSIRELTAVFYSQWHEPQEISKYEERMFTDLIDALTKPDRCQCIGENGRFLYNCDECPR